VNSYQPAYVADTEATECHSLHLQLFSPIKEKTPDQSPPDAEHELSRAQSAQRGTTTALGTKKGERKSVHTSESDQTKGNASKSSLDMTYQALTRLKRELEEAGLSDAFGRQAYDHGRQSIVASSSADGFGMEAHGMATRELLRTSHGDSNDAFITLRQFHQ